MTKVIFVNGPPRAGKDEAARVLEQKFQLDHLKFADILHEFGFAMLDDLNLDDDQIQYYTTDGKMEPLPVLGISYRQFLIGLSEDFMKPKFGKDIFGRLAAGKVKLIQSFNDMYNEANNIVFSDSGFAHEAVPIIEAVGAENCFLIHIVREGCDFSKDSRSYIDLRQYGVETVTINNNESLERYHELIELWYRTTVDNLPLA